MSRFEKGWAKLQEIEGEFGVQSVENMKKFSPTLADWIVEFGFGDIYARPVLDLKQRELLTISSLITQGEYQNPLQFHIRAALHVGLTPEEVVEAILHVTPYAGFPKVIGAIQTTMKVFQEMNISYTDPMAKKKK